MNSTVITQAKIAKEAGVHRTVVNKVLRGQGLMYAEDTRLRITQIAERLGYSSVRRMRPYARVHERAQVEWGVTLRLKPYPGLPSILGEGVMKNLGLGGAWIFRLRLSPPCVPISPKIIWEIVFRDGPFKGRTFLAVMSRANEDGLAVKWKETPQELKGWSVGLGQ